MSNMKRKIITHEEIWDDTALIESWEEALQEYKLYHSIQARGERVADVLAKLSQPNHEMDDQQRNQDERNPSDSQPDRMGEQHEDLEDGEVEQEPGVGNLLNAAQIDIGSTEGADAQEKQESSLPHGAHPSQTGPNAVPQVLVGVQDEGLKNLMMSWYYAGYYTGLYEGQQRAKQQSTRT
ncbi:MAG: hypothetical protein M1816_005860 [Peltula sp. TS41687]|nr:MAG: hypothetical protein M1816_005860 [Peltula sp. TS41687]